MVEKSKDFKDQWIASFVNAWDEHRKLHYSKRCFPEHWTFNEKGVINELVSSSDGRLEAVQLMYMPSGNKLKEFDRGMILFQLRRGKDINFKN
jgi:hypothetical protein